MNNRFAVQIQMYDICNGTLTFLYKNKMPLGEAEVTQDFTNVGGTKPTTYVKRIDATFKANVIREKLVEIHHELKKIKINRTFDVSVVEYPTKK